MEILTLTNRHELYSLDYTRDSKFTWKQISRWSYKKQDHDIGIKNKIYTVVSKVKDQNFVEINLQSTLTP